MTWGSMTHLAADRMACPVCGHPTGDCAPDGQGAIKVLPGKTHDPNATVTVGREVHQEVRINGLRRSRVRLYNAGSKITEDEAERIGLFDCDLPLSEPLILPCD